MPPLNLLSAGNNKETEEKQIAYCLQQLQVLPSKSMIVFSSKSALKRFFFALYAAVPDGMDIFGEDMGGGFSKLLDKWKNSTAGKRLLLTTWRQLRRFPAGVLQVEWIALQALPFNPPSPIHKVRSAEYGNGFINYTMPQVYNHVYESLSHFQLASYQEKPPSQLTLLDGRFQTAEYAQFITESLKSITSE